ncbi:MAG: hypothetical protein FD165_1069 [Gammaproteobacteria bacterium]|nr:MAG: hypothetical protein FD165_1069 [Gammaproteobacteria bacterium]TND06223.1 MAG: hypothetical protein FD120_710 [Gammaproteobacteria bacterium]
MDGGAQDADEDGADKAAKKAGSMHETGNETSEAMQRRRDERKQIMEERKADEKKAATDSGVEEPVGQ